MRRKGRSGKERKEYCSLRKQRKGKEERVGKGGMNKRKKGNQRDRKRCME